MITAGELAAWVTDARQCTMELIADLRGEQLWGPRLDRVNPLIWEAAHAAWFHERRILRELCNEPPVRPDANALYDSIAVSHDDRWGLPLPSLEGTLAYMQAVRDRVLELLRRVEPTEALAHYVMYSVCHEDMHTEAITYTRQTLGYPRPRLSLLDGTALVQAHVPASPPLARSLSKGGHASPVSDEVVNAGPWPGDVEVPGGTFWLGTSPDTPFAFDNEKWAHPVEVAPFAIARAPVTQAEFAAFVDDGGYRRPELWDEDGRRWREKTGAEHPVYWRRDPGGAWQRRDFDTWVPLEPHRPVIHVNWYEAGAYCRWAGRRLPTEAEWEIAAAGEPDSGGRGLSPRKRRYPWGDTPPAPERANLDFRAMGCVDVGAHPAGDSVFGCRQMLGNVWEWTSTTFLPFPGFVADFYREYSQPWFKTRKVLRGGAWTTRSRLIWNTWRNFYKPDQNEVLAGFRTCRL